MLRLKGIHNPLLDHPGWRQGDTASIARNFALLQSNILYPQTNYNGPPPNYVELELQIVPFTAALLYKIFGVHEIFGRLISIGFSLGTVAIVAYFGRWLFGSIIAGLAAALLFAIMPGSFFYGRTFTPDTTMVFFLAAALYAIARYVVEDEGLSWRGLAATTSLLTLAFLAKPVALAAYVPILAMTVERARNGRTMRWERLAVLYIVPFVLLYLYDRSVAAHAEWHWASAITQLHVLPALKAAMTGSAAFLMKWAQFRQVLGMLSYTMLGPGCTALAILGLIFLPKTARSPWLLWGWLIGGVLYTYVVVTVERVDYYMYLLLPLAALSGGAFIGRIADAVAVSTIPRAAKYAAALVAAIFLVAVVQQNRAIAKPYYAYKKSVYRNAIALDKTLKPNALIVMGHYDPSVLYYIGRYGWEEDPFLWTPFDEQSAIRKGARYFIDIEHNRFTRNVELCAWMQRFPVINRNAEWPVYETDPKLVKPNAEKEWREFRNAEKAGKAREWLDTHGYCRTNP
ncbi:MAG: glycosyltransferase family 39 protein [Candidatus Eremiobacteraeota bacterium]|nr:glycosyltransferase family 39 protein [Candidatus Eremiobacteraeota bacterium]